MKIDIGIEEKERLKVADGLSKLLADSTVLYMKTHGFHWNVEGAMFTGLHGMFLNQYTEMWQSLDGIAERIRTLGSIAPASLKKLSELSTIPEFNGKNLSAKDMIHQLLLGNEALAKSARSVRLIAQSASDDVTVDLATKRMDVHEKNAWMLRSILHD
jgi:starvation-inducible DNA-binding protein